ncbi:alpha/beta fold hydrolase [Streptomyces sp. NPDC020807]|uniref:alpha/beta fold hydrolase n=1 Tax=Streptomyces sp. NPDC020807 TaxID=3155119 RepID=UPI00340182B1
MTAFVLVAGAFTGGWVWGGTVAGLRAAGAEAYAVTLTGMDGESGAEDRVVDLETHVDDVLRLVDGLTAREVVLVGHGYGLRPVLAAADRRPGRIARLVALDTALPQHGETALSGVQDPDVLARTEADPGAPRIPAPTRDTWPRWGSTEGVPAEALDRLARLAAPQPRATFTQPLRLTGAAATLPVTGFLCTANGASLDIVRMLVASGPPQFQALAQDHVRFIELATGHWPMLSDPAGLATALLRAAAGEGERVTAPELAAATEHATPSHLLPFLLDVPEAPRERHGRVDLHLPDAGEPRPAVVFVHGGPVAPGRRPTPRDTPFFLGYGRYAASLGAVGATLDHRLHGLGDYPRAAEDLAEAVAFVRADPRVDPDRIALWFFSTGGPLAADWLAAPPPWLRCVAASYPALGPLPGWGAVDPRFRPADVVGTADGPPVVLTRAGREHPAFADTVQAFLDAAARRNADVEIVDVPDGHHAFELVDPTDASRAAVERAMRSVLGHLGHVGDTRHLDHVGDTRHLGHVGDTRHPGHVGRTRHPGRTGS